ncbi:MAG: ABC transporter ATP-binding protein/permease [Clostridium sp.]
MLKIKDVSKKYRSEYGIKDINLEIGTGLNYIIGPSGSGKTTLIKIISGLDDCYEGDVTYLGKSLKNLSDKEKAFYYNNKFGFIWQDFSLIEDMTVEENILFSAHIKDINAKKELEKVLVKLKITSVRNKKVKLLSGGQKQRVAIARELIKNPEVIIADEPTSALDSKSSSDVMKILNELAESKIVIIVTHDTSYINENSKVYEIDKGEIISKPNTIEDNLKEKKVNSTKKLGLGESFKIAKTLVKRKLSRSLILGVSLVISTILISTSLLGGVSSSGNQEFEKLFEEYGDTILDISINKSFMSAQGGNKSDDPSTNVNQDIKGLYEKYMNDDRVEYLLFNRAFDNINIGLDGQNYTINSSGNIPVVNKIIAGTTPKNKGEVLVPKSFVAQIGGSNEDVIGKTIDFKASVYSWDNGYPEPKDIKINAKIVGVADTTIKSNANGKSYEFDIEDSFFFDKDTVTDVNQQIGNKNNNHDFVIRAKDPNSLIEIKNEISKEGIVPVGQFELIEDIVKLNSQTNKLSKSSTIIIVALGILGIGIISALNSFMSKKDYAVYKICGYSNSQISSLLFAQSMSIAVISAIGIIVLSPVLSIITKASLGVSLTSMNMLGLCSLVSICLGLGMYVISYIVARKANPILVLKSGER